MSSALAGSRNEAPSPSPFRGGCFALVYAVGMNLQPAPEAGVLLASLVQHPDNARQGDVGAIAESLQRLGQYRPIVVSRATNHIVAGNHTHQAAAALGWDTIDVVWVTATRDQELAILVADNRTSDLATYDLVQLADTLQQVAGSAEGLVGVGYDTEDLDDLLAEIEEYAVPYAPPVDRYEGEDLGVAGMATTQDRKLSYAEHQVRNIILTYEGEQYRTVADQLAELRAEYDADSNSEAVARLLEDHLAD